MGGGASSISCESEPYSPSSPRKCSHGCTSSHTVIQDASYWCSGGYTVQEGYGNEAYTREILCEHGCRYSHQVQKSSESYCYGPT